MRALCDGDLNDAYGEKWSPCRFQWYSWQDFLMYVVCVGSQGGNVEGKPPSNSDESQTVIKDDSKVWA